LFGKVLNANKDQTRFKM